MSEGIELRPVGSSTPKPPPRRPDTDGAPGSLSSAYRRAEEKAKAVVHLQEGQLDSISIWGLVSTAWFAILGIPLLLLPRILLFFAQTPPPPTMIATSIDRDHYDTLSPLESFLCLTLSLGLFSMSLLTLFIVVPSYTPPSSNPSRWPTLAVLVGLTSIMGVVSWNNPVGGLGKVVGIGNGFVAIWGWWVVGFGQGRSGLAKVGKKHHPKRWEQL